MRFNELIHWSDGLFLQPHHMQEQQRSLINMKRAERDMYLPYSFGLADFELDVEALNAQRIVVKRLSAIMPDGQEVSMPGNASLRPITLTAPEDIKTDNVTVYLAVPNWSEFEANLSADGSGKRLYTVKETDIRDENTGDNEIVVLKRSVNARLVTSPDEANDCSLLPIVQLECVSRNTAEPKFAIGNYIPPYLLVTKDCPLMATVSELVFQLRRRRDKIVADISEKGYNPENLTGTNIHAVLQLRTLNVYEARIGAMLASERITPFILYTELRSLLGELAALQPLSKREDVAPYYHVDIMPVFEEIITNIRSLIMAEGYAGYTRIDFKESEEGMFYNASISNADVSGSKEFFLAVVCSADTAVAAHAIESGDNFKLINPLAKTERIRGIKLDEMRYPPRFLPVLSNAAWFRICKEESAVIWKRMCEEGAMVIDLSHDKFPDFSASLFITSVISEGNTNE